MSSRLRNKERIKQAHVQAWLQKGICNQSFSKPQAQKNRPVKIQAGLSRLKALRYVRGVPRRRTMRQSDL